MYFIKETVLQDNYKEQIKKIKKKQKQEGEANSSIHYILDFLDFLDSIISLTVTEILDFILVFQNDFNVSVKAYNLFLLLNLTEDAITSFLI